MQSPVAASTLLQLAAEVLRDAQHSYAAHTPGFVQWKSLAIGKWSSVMMSLCYGHMVAPFAPIGLGQNSGGPHVLCHTCAKIWIKILIII